MQYVANTVRGDLPLRGRPLDRPFDRPFDRPLDKSMASGCRSLSPRFDLFSLVLVFLRLRSRGEGDARLADLVAGGLR